MNELLPIGGDTKGKSTGQSNSNSMTSTTSDVNTLLFCRRFSIAQPSTNGTCVDLPDSYTIISNADACGDGVLHFVMNVFCTLIRYMGFGTGSLGEQVDLERFYR
jgi:hypothetical protein